MSWDDRGAAAVGVVGRQPVGLPGARGGRAPSSCELEVAAELRVVSAHRTPDHLFRYAEEAAGRGIRVIIAGAGGAAHLPGMLAAKTLLPVIGVPIPTQHLGGMDSLLSIVQMPRGIPVATVAIGNAMNAGLLAARSSRSPTRRSPQRLAAWREAQTAARDGRPLERRDLKRRSVRDDGPGWRDVAVLGEVEADVEHRLEHDQDRDGGGRSAGEQHRHGAEDDREVQHDQPAVRREHQPGGDVTPVLAAPQEVPARTTAPWLMASAMAARGRRRGRAPMLVVPGPSVRNSGSVSTKMPWTNQKIP